MTYSGLLNRVLRVEGESEAARVTESEILECLDEIRAMVVGDLEGAIAMLDRVTLVVDRSGSDRAQARLGSVRGHALNYASRYDEAEQAASQSASLAESMNDAVEMGRAHMVLVHSHAKLGHLPIALESALRAERAFIEQGDLSLAAQALSNAGIVTRMMGDAPRAIDMFERALALREHEPATRAQIESGLAEVYLDVGRYAEAESAFLRSAETFESIGIQRAASVVRGSLADLYGRQGRLSAAINQFEVARRFFEEDRAYGELGRILTEQADVFATIGLTDDAIRGYRRAGELLERAGSVQEWARSLLGLGRMLSPRDAEAAAEALDKSACLSADAGSNAARALAQLHRVRLDLDRGNLDEVDALLHDLTQVLAGRLNETVLCQMTRADLYLANGSHEQAEALLSESMDDSITLGHPIYHAELLWRRAVVRRTQGETDSALSDIRDAIEVIERIRGTLQGSRFRAGLIGGTRSVYGEAVNLLLGSNAINEAFEVTERARGRTLLDLLGGGAELDSIINGEDPAAQGVLRDLSQAKANLNTVYSEHDPTGPAEKARDWLERIQQAEDRVSTLETRVLSSGRARDLLGVPESFDSIANELGEGHALVSYWIGDDAMRCFVIRERHAEVFTLGTTTDEIDGLLGDVMFQIRRGLVRGPVGSGQNRRAESCRETLARLTDAIWSPMASAFDGIDRVSIVPAGPLHAVPFAALRIGNQYLGETIEPVLLPTASLMPILGRVLDTESAGISVLAVPDASAPEIEAEANTLRDMLPDAEVIVGMLATSDAAMCRAASSRVLHLACHGAFPASNPLAAGLKLADRWVTVRDVLSWTLPGSTVVLSACDAGRHAQDIGEELFGFARGFFAAGARGLVMSHWRAHDAAAHGLMAETYRSLGGRPQADGIRPALLEAQRSQICAGLHPAFWANFFYMGV